MRVVVCSIKTVAEYAGKNRCALAADTTALTDGEKAAAFLRDKPAGLSNM